MCSSTPCLRATGFALAEVLVAVLLLALATIGAGTAMVHSLAGQRAALLRTRAADLAADLAEALRSVPDSAAQDAEVRAWQSTVLLQLPQAQATARRQPASPATGFDVHLRWRDGDVPTPSNLTLPLSIGASP